MATNLYRVLAIVLELEGVMLYTCVEVCCPACDTDYEHIFAQCSDDSQIVVLTLPAALRVHVAKKNVIFSSCFPSYDFRTSVLTSRQHRDT